MNMRNALKILLSILILLLLALAIFISQLYNPAILWLIAFSLIPLSVILRFLIASRVKFGATILAFSLIINAGLIAKVPFGNPIIEIAAYAVGLLFAIWILIVYLSELVFSYIRKPTLIADRTIRS